MTRYRSVPAVTVADLRQAPGNDELPFTDENDDEQVDAEPELSYRDLQARAKELEIPANQSREDLEAAVAEAER